MLLKKRTLRTGSLLLIVLAVVVACGPAPAPQVIKETVIVAGTPEVVEVTKVVEETVEKVVTATPLPKRDVIIVPCICGESLDPAIFNRCRRPCSATYSMGWSP
jgi:hypothetical protein